LRFPFKYIQIDGQWAFFRPGPYDWVHHLRPSGKCFCDVYRTGVDGRYEAELGTILMDLADYPIKRSLWLDNGIYLRISDGYTLVIDLNRSMDELGLYEDVFFWGC
jgi:hypothetical protein